MVRPDAMLAELRSRRVESLANSDMRLSVYVVQ